MPPFLSESSFWSFVVAAIAVVLSQVSPVRLWFKKASLDLEIHNSIYVSHLIGVQLFQVYVSLINTGGRSIRVRSLQLSVTRNDQETTTLPVAGVFLKPEDKTSILFIPFRSSPGDEWVHNCNFIPIITRDQDRQYRESKSALKTNIEDKIQQRRNMAQLADRIKVPGRGGLVEGDEAVVAPIMDQFNQNFSLVAGEYRMTVTATTDKITVSKHYDFTIFESDERDLRDVAEEYKYGAWIYWDRTDKDKYFRIPIREAT